ncbi:hypothetical protein HOA92_00345 [archaeon]|jgi:hypothetical protein|nr:hypothetical protein [archaeon]
MTLKKVVVTFDPGNTDIFRQGFMRYNEETYVKDTYLFPELKRLGVDVTILEHEAGESSSDAAQRFGPVFEAADLIFHESRRVAYGVGAKEWRGEYAKGIEELIQRDFLKKSHLIGSNGNPIAYKHNGSKLASDAGALIPAQWNPSEYLASDRPLPVVIKPVSMNGGSQIFFLDRAEQVATIFDDEKYKNNAFFPPTDGFNIIQKFVETPSDHFTHYRIFTLGDGRIIGAVLHASSNKKSGLKRLAEPGPFDWGSHIYDNVKSPLYLGRFDIVSNVAQGGFQIPMNPNRESALILGTDQRILTAHNLDQYHPQLPDALAAQATNVAKAFRQHGVVYGGQDWMQDKQGNFYFIEINEYPGMAIFNTLYSGGQETDAEFIAQNGAKHLARGLVEWSG